MDPSLGTRAEPDGLAIVLGQEVVELAPVITLHLDRVARWLIISSLAAHRECAIQLEFEWRLGLARHVVCGIERACAAAAAVATNVSISHLRDGEISASEEVCALARALTTGL